jgi:rubrerythrin
VRHNHLRVRWHELSPTAGESPVAATADASTKRPDIWPLLLRVGIPVVEGAESARDFALALLTVAAEVEHALMVQYIYAAMSVSPDPAPDGVVYRDRLLRVAVQEMGHLATVQNLLLLLGGRDAFHLQRDEMRQCSDKNPIPFVLAPISASSIAIYVAAEMPAEVPPELAERVAQLVELAEHEAGVDIHRVGVIYELLQWMFGPAEGDAPIDFAELAPLPDPPALAEADLQDPMVVDRYEARREEWQVFDDDIILPTIRTRAEARAALIAVSAQGEGLQDLESSHFAAFLQMDRAFRNGDIVVRPMATAPTLGTHAGAAGALITHPYTRLWADVFNLQYQLLVVTLYQAFGTPRSDDDTDGPRQKLADLAMFGMRRVIGPIAEIVAELPLRADGSGAAGPPFELDPAVLASNEGAQLTAQQIHLLDQLAMRYADVEAEPDFPTHPLHANALANLRNFDTRRRNAISSPPPSSRRTR